MPLDILRNRREGTAQNSSGAPVLTGWAAVEDNMKKYDDGVMTDFANDIDTLLVFAGLFSAVLTAFVVESYQSLQPDNSQLSVELLCQISTKLSSFQVSQPFVNATSSPSSTTPFQAPTSAIAINALWFLSLIFSLAAALFGILVKQWIREYLQWNSVISPARDNVLIRQVRFEAWRDWKVPAIISAIPALLEIGVVLFFGGMIVFLWTLEPTVAIIVTIAIGVFWGLAILVTVLPTFSRHCPYKTPTGWAFVVLGSWLHRNLRRLWVRLQHWRKLFVVDWWTWRHLNIRAVPRQWRQRDLQIIDSQTVLAGPKGPHLGNLDVILDISALQILTRALAWMLCGSSEIPSLRIISQCVHSLHTTRVHPNNHKDGRDREARDPALYHAATTHVLRKHPLGASHATGIGDLAAVHRKLESPDRLIQAVGFYSLKTDLHIRWISQSMTAYLSPEEKLKAAWVLRRLALREVQVQLGGWTSKLSLWYQQNAASRFHSESSLDEEPFEEEATRTVSLLCLLRLYYLESIMIPFDDQDPHFVQDTLDTLVEIYNNLADAPFTYHCGIATLVLETLCTMSEVKFTSVGTVSAKIDISPNNVMNHAISLATQLCDCADDFPVAVQERRHMFVIISDFALRCLAARGAGWYSECANEQYPDGDFAALLCNMLLTAENSLVSNERNCGGYVDLPWLCNLLKILEQQIEAFPQRVEYKRKYDARKYDYYEWFLCSTPIRKTVLRLLWTLRRSSDAGLLTGKDTERDLQRCFDLLRDLSSTIGCSTFDIDVILGVSVDLRANPCVDGHLEDDGDVQNEADLGETEESSIQDEQSDGIPAEGITDQPVSLSTRMSNALRRLF